jgi:hypothetical protein
MVLSIRAGAKSAGLKKKGAQSSGPVVGSQALKPSPRYPQNLWITLWVEPPRGTETAAICVNPLAWSNNDHYIKAFLISGLRRVYRATGLKPDVMPLFKCPPMGICA